MAESNQFVMDIASDSKPDNDFYEVTRYVTGLFVYPVICIVGLTGNSMALVVLCQPTMATSYNVILASMAVNDVIKLMNDLLYFVDVILQLVNPLAENALFGHAYPISHYIFNQTACVHAWLNVLVTIERYICVVHPTRYRSLCTVRRAAFIVAIVVTSMSLIAAPSAFRYRTTSKIISVPYRAATTALHHQESCNYGVYDRDDSTVSSSVEILITVNRTIYDVQTTALGSDPQFVIIYYGWILALVRSLVPLFLLTALNAKVVCAVWRRPNPSNLHCSATISTADQRNNGERRAAQNCNVTMMLAIVVVVFAVCIVPDAVLSVVFRFGYVDERDQLAKGIRELTDALLALSSAVNFVVYCLCSRRFRDVYLATVCGRRGATRLENEIHLEHIRRAHVP